MHFKKLEIHGFKSFADPVVIEFHKGITCVVGPNGSGKSNVCDAIRWVLGAQSAKMLRGDKMEDVIFSGTASRKSRGMAEVTLIIDNQEGLLPIEYNEVAITRRMFRSGESEYLINNNPCRMKDIRELIMDTGIGVEGYSIIGQGKISDIISNNTESIREILEETAGIVMYRSRKGEAERKLTTATSNMKRVGDIIGEIEGRIDGLREDSEKAEEFLKLQERNRELEINITLKNMESIEKKSAAIKEDMVQLRRDMDKKRGERQELTQALALAREKRDRLDQVAEEKTSEHLAAVEAVNALVNQGEVRRERLAAISANHKRLEEEIQELSHRIQREEKDKSHLTQRWEKIKQELKDREETVEKIVEEHRVLEEKLFLKKNALDEKKNKLVRLNSEVGNKTVEIKSLESLRETLKSRQETLMEEREEEEISQSHRTKVLQSQEKELSIMVEETEKTRQSLKKHKEKREKLRKKTEALGREREALTMEIGRLSSRKKTFEEMESNYEGYNAGVRFIMGENLSGIEGVVAELIRVPEGYETAVETALGAAMQNIICEDDDSAKTAIGRLKERKGGRLTFLPLESLRSRKLLKQEAIEGEPGFKGYGWERVSSEEKHKKVVEYLLGNLAIVEGMDQAVKLSKKIKGGFKIVTLEGEIINAGGAITGGRYRNKSANILERRREIENLGQEIDERERAERKKTEGITDFKKEMSSLDEEILGDAENLRASERRIIDIENEMKLTQSSIEALERGREKREKELESIRREEEDSRTTVDKLKREVEEGRKILASLEKETEEECRVYERETGTGDLLEEEIIAKKIDLGKVRGEKEKLEALGTRGEESVRNLKLERERKKEALAAQEREKEEIQSSHKVSQSAVKEKEEIRESLYIALEKLREEKIEIEKAIDEKNREREEADKYLGTLQNAVTELEIKKTRGETQLENAREKLWEDFELSYIQAVEFRKEEFSQSAAVKENREIRERMKELEPVNIGAIEEYEKVSKRYEFLTRQREDIHRSMEELTSLIQRMDRTIRSKFKDSFEQVVKNFESVFRELHGGGEARITLKDESDPFESEVEITAQPPGKQLKNINLLSGGEKTMTAIALMFAVLKTKPTPCCILDEVEAALDDSNLNVFGRYLRNFHGVQFTLITHQKATMEHADVMYGITMPESGVSKVYSLKMDEEEAVC